MNVSKKSLTPCLSPAEALRRAGPAPCLDSTVELALAELALAELALVELALAERVQVSQPQDESLGEVAPLLICYKVA